MKVEKVMPIAWLLIAVAVEVILHLALPIVKVVPKYWNLLGIIPLGLGVGANYLADVAFRQTNTTVRPMERPARLLKDGLFGVSRNPMYLGMLLALVGVAILLRSLTPYLVVIGFAVLITRFFIAPEESMLAGQFGAEWTQYKRHTRRWL